MALFNIGSAAIGRDEVFAPNTIVVKNNPGDTSGAITSVEIWCATNLANTEVATFIVVSADDITSRDSEAIGAVTAGSKQTFSGLDMSVEVGDLIGIYFSSGSIERAYSGAGLYYRGGDFIPITNGWMSSLADNDISLYGAGGTLDLPTVTTQATDDIAATTSTGNGNITATGGENADHRGIVYGKTSRGDPGDTKYDATLYDNYEDEAGSFGTGAFDRALTGLDTGTTYYARAYAHNSAGYAYGAEVNWETLAAGRSFGIIMD